MKIEAKHLAWIFEAAGDHFTEQVNRLESEVIRHEYYLAKPDSDPLKELVRGSFAPKSRQERYEEATEALKVSREIVKFCKAARMKAADVSAAEFAKAFKGAFKL